MLEKLINDETRGLIKINQDNNLMAKPLAKQFDSMLKAVAEADRATWKFYTALANIIDNELYKLDNCETVKEFCEKYKIAQPLATRAKLGVKNLKVLAEYGYDEKNITVSKSYILARLGENQKAFLEYCKQNKIDLSALGEKGMELKIKEYITFVNGAIDNGTETTGNENNTAENENNTAENESKTENKGDSIRLDDGMVYISLKGKLYAIELEDLKDYEVIA